MKYGKWNYKGKADAKFLADAGFTGEKAPKTSAGSGI